MCKPEQGFYQASEAFEKATKAVNEFAIQANVAMPKQRRKAGAMPANVAKAVATYKEEYRRLYGVNVLAIEYKNGYIYVEQQAGVSLKIFKTRISQLKFRNG